MADKEIWNEERDYLTGTITSMQEEMTEIDQKFKHGVHAADEASRESVRQSLEQRYRNLTGSMDSPYFARIDFTARCEEKVKVYIGKTPVYSGDNRVVTDWRAPIANLYYDGSTGLTEYKSPEGRVKGELTLKRQLTVADRELIKIEDVYISTGVPGFGTQSSVTDREGTSSVSTAMKQPSSISKSFSTSDSMLMSFLSASADAQLKDIVATIQAEQNTVIRADIRKNLIVQGVAGSGKTTVALHRVAYLADTLGR